MLEARALAFDRQCGRSPQTLVSVHQPLPCAFECPSRSARKAGPQAIELGVQLDRIRDDELRSGGRRGGAYVSREIAERRVLFVSDRRDDRNGTLRDCAQEPLVAERQEIFEAPTSAREDDDVQLVDTAQRTQSVDHRRRGEWPLHVRLGDDDARGRETRRDRRGHVPLRRGVVSGDEPDSTWQARQRPLSLGREQPLVR